MILIFTVQLKEVLAQKVDSNINNYSIKTLIKPEILTSGFIDIINNGQVNASARFIRLYIGEPGKFALPLSIYPKLTRSGIIYHFGERILTGQKTGLTTNPATGKPVNFLNSFGITGLYFQTGAWERNDAKNVGIFWLALRYIGCYTNPSQIREFLPDIQTNGIYHGYSIGWGVEINKLVNIKVLYYKYKKKPEIEYSMPIYQFSFNYSLKN